MFRAVLFAVTVTINYPRSSNWSTLCETLDRLGTDGMSTRVVTVQTRKRMPEIGRERKRGHAVRWSVGGTGHTRGIAAASEPVRSPSAPLRTKEQHTRTTHQTRRRDAWWWVCLSIALYVVYICVWLERKLGEREKTRWQPTKMYIKRTHSRKQSQASRRK